MAGIVSAIGAVASVINTVNTHSNGYNPNSIFHKEKDNILMSSNGSITKLLSKYIVEPIIICTESAKETEVFDKVCSLNADIFSGFYIQAFEILARDSGLDSSTIVDVMSTDRGTVGGVLLRGVKNGVSGAVRYAATKAIQKSMTASTESNEHPNYLSGLFKDGARIKISTEAKDPVQILTDIEDGINDIKAGLKEKQEKDKERFSVTPGYKQGDLEDSVGYAMLQRTFNVNFKYKGNNGFQTIEIPIIVKAHIIVTDIDNIIAMLRPNTEENKWYWRLLAWKADEISFRELVFGGDLVAKYKQDRLRDKDNLFNTISRRRESAAVTKFDTKITGFEKFFNMLVISSDDKIKLDRHMRGNIMDERIKQELLTQATAMTATVIDPDYERVTMLTRDIRGRSEVGFKALSKKKDNDSSHFTEMLKALMMNKPMAF